MALWTPALITTAGWWDASDASTITESSNKVSQWDDKSGNGNDLLQATGAKQPTTNSVTIGGLNAINFDGTDDYLRDASGVSRSVPYFHIGIIRTDTGAADSANYFGSGAGNSGAVYQNSSFYKLYSNATLQDGATSASTETLIAGMFNGASSEIWVNGVEDNTGNVGSDVHSGMVVGAGNSGAFNRSDMYAGEILVLDEDPSTETREKIEGYLAWKWGIEASLPASHTYRYYPPIDTELWTPALITMSGWYDASDASTITESSGAVSQWDDKSGNGNDVAQPTGSKQPTTDSRTLNSLNVLDFVNASGEYLYDFSLSGTDTASYDFYVVLKRDDNNGNRYIGVLNNTAGDGQIRMNRFAEYSVEVVSSAGSGEKTDTGGDTNPHIINYRWSGSQIQLFVDGTQYSTDVALGGTVGHDRLYIGSDVFGNLTHDGYIGEFIWATHQALADRQIIEGYLAWKWGLQANLPAGHPYEDFPPGILPGNPYYAYRQQG